MAAVLTKEYREQARKYKYFDHLLHVFYGGTKR